MSKLGYISGDLVMTNGVSGGTAKDVVYKVASSDPSRISVLDDGTVLDKNFSKIGDIVKGTNKTAPHDTLYVKIVK